MSVVGVAVIVAVKLMSYQTDCFLVSSTCRPQCTNTGSVNVDLSVAFIMQCLSNDKLYCFCAMCSF